MYGRELAGPQSAFLVAAGWGLVGWGLFQIRNWARWSALVLMVLGIAAGIPAVSAAATDLNWRLAWYGGLMMAKIVAAWYLARSPEAIEAFKGNTEVINQTACERSNCLPLRFRRFFLSHALADLEFHLAGFLVGVDDHVVAMQNLSIENLQGQRILHQLLN